MNKINGTIKISDEIIINIAGFSALEVEGVESVVGFSSDAANSSKALTEANAISISLKNGNVDLDLILNIKYGYEIPKVTLEVQKAIKNQIKSMTGLDTNNINIIVNSLVK